MPSLNKVLIIGNATRDPEIKYTAKGTAIADVGLAVNRSYKGENGERREEVTFVDVTVWGKAAEFVGEYCRKGASVFVEGHLQLDTWEDKQTGQKRSKLKIVADNVQLLGGREDSAREPDRPRGQYQQRQQRQEPRPAPRDPDLDSGDEDSIPFNSEAHDLLKNVRTIERLAS